MKTAILLLASVCALWGDTYRFELKTLCTGDFGGYASTNFQFDAGDTAINGVLCSSSTTTYGVTSIPVNHTSKLYFDFDLLGTFSTLTLTVKYSSNDSADAATVQPFFACVSTGTPISPTYASAASAQTLTPSATYGTSTATFTLSTSGCSGGNTYRAYLQIATASGATATWDVQKVTVLNQ
jgi:hypothetical protein